MTIFYKTIICPSCKEDYLIITLNNSNNRLYLNCSECEASWYSIEEAKQDINMFIEPNIDRSDPDINEIKKRGWENLITGEIEI